MKFPKTLLFLGLLSVLENYAGSTTTHLKITPRITNGNQAGRRQFPYQAGLRYGDIWCGGSVISNLWILTAAHCVDDIKNGIEVYLGAWNRLDRKEKGQQRIFVQKRNIIVHENWSPGTLRNDIALIRLPHSVNFNEYVQRVNLPKIAGSYSSYAGKYAIASGWGYTSSESDDPTNILRWVKVPIIKNSICKATWGEWVHPSNICIDTKGGKSTCFADSGGPLVLASDKPVQIGLTSFGRTSCGDGAPAVFTRVTSYLDWIRRHTGIVGK